MADETESGVTPSDSTRRRAIGPADQPLVSPGAFAAAMDAQLAAARRQEDAAEAGEGVAAPPPVPPAAPAAALPEEEEEVASEFVPEPDRLHTSQEVNLRKELFKMAKAQGLKPEQLNEFVSVRRSVYFGAVIKEHYRARDIGYAEGMRDGLRARWPAPLWFGIGAAAPFVVMFLAKLVVFIAYVYNFKG